MASKKRLTWKRSLDGFEDVGLREGVTVGDEICKLADLEEKDTVAVTRCKGCRFASADLTECTIKFDQDGEPLTVDPMYYCADGKPRRVGRR